MTDRPTDSPLANKRQTDKGGHREIHVKRSCNKTKTRDVPNKLCHFSFVCNK